MSSDREFVGTNCSECLLPVEAASVLPCLTCSEARYCSLYCHRQAQEGPHK